MNIKVHRGLDQIGKKYFIDGEEIKARKKASGKWFETQDNIKYYPELDRKNLLIERFRHLWMLVC